jgi:hypothetical protein
MVLVAKINCIQIVLMGIKLLDLVCEKVYPWVVGHKTNTSS